MTLYPAIDMLDGKPVRLFKGDYGQSTQVYSDIVSAAKWIEASQAGWVHMVDLNGAKTGRPFHLDQVKEVLDSTQLKVELGGGIRDMATLETWLSLGVSRVILGTAALANPAFLKEALKRYGSQVVVGMDCLDGFVRTSGWLENSRVHYLDFVQEMIVLGVHALIVTDISRDGTLTGMNMALYQELVQLGGIDIIASGGLSSMVDLEKLAQIGVEGCVLGKSIYVPTIDLKKAVAQYAL